MQELKQTQKLKNALTTETKIDNGISVKKSLSNLKKPGKPEGFLDKALGYGKGNTVIDLIINKLASLLEKLRDWLLGNTNSAPVVQKKKKKLGTNEDEK